MGARQEVLSQHYVRTILNAAADAAGIADAGKPVTFTPHDFRRLFTTEMVGSGLPLHIAAALLGHIDLETTRGYTAVFPEEVIIRHQNSLPAAAPSATPPSTATSPQTSGPTSRSTSSSAASN